MGLPAAPPPPDQEQGGGEHHPRHGTVQVKIADITVFVNKRAADGGGQRGDGADRQQLAEKIAADVPQGGKETAALGRDIDRQERGRGGTAAGPAAESDGNGRGNGFHQHQLILSS